MALLGIDFGTTNTVVALHDRGSYPVLLHSIQTRIGRVSHEVYPSLIYDDSKTGTLSYGLEAERSIRQRPATEGQQIRSLKRILPKYRDGLQVEEPGGILVKQALVGFLQSLRDSVLGNGLFPAHETLECVITWPAHANGAQRAVTREAFQEAGFKVVGSLNEPTASALEYADRITGGNPRAVRKLTQKVAVFDFGGGTLDVSLLVLDKGEVRVLDTLGLESLGGDDLDRVLLELFLENLQIDPGSLSLTQEIQVLAHARVQKETLGTQSARSLLINPRDFGLKGRTTSIPTDAYIERIRPLVEKAVDRLEELVRRATARKHLGSARDLDAIYLVGGSSKLPLVQQVIATRIPGAKVVTTHKPFTSVAVGAAIYASAQLEVRDIFSRHFGVLRLQNNGTREFMDVIFSAGTKLPGKGHAPLDKVLRYSPRHNIGHLRYMECLDLSPEGLPGEGFRSWSEILFPYDPHVGIEEPLGTRPIADTLDLQGTEVEERYRCDSDGIITVEVTRLADGRKRKFEIFHQ